MDVRTFVTQAMTQIREGVEDAHFRSQSLPAGVFLRPSHIEREKAASAPLPEIVEFDLAVIVHRPIDQRQGSASELLSVCSENCDGSSNGALGVAHESASRVRFCVELGKTSSILKKPLRGRPLGETNLTA